MNLSLKSCLEGQGAVCSMLQKGCSMAKTPGMASADEELLCQSVEALCPQQLAGFDLAASICLQKSMHVCDAATEICQAQTDPAQARACMAAFQKLCPQVGK
jgi:hypothetical protein